MGKQMNIGLPDTLAPSMYKVGEPEGLSLLKREMDEAGVDYVVAPGRYVTVGPKAVDPAGAQSMIVSDQILLDLRKSFDNRLFGLHGLDLNLPTDQLVAGLEKAITKHGLYGAVMEPGYFAAPEGGTPTADHKKLYPLYETLIKLDVFLMHQSGIYAGADIGVSDWVMQAFQGRHRAIEVANGVRPSAPPGRANSLLVMEILSNQAGKRKGEMYVNTDCGTQGT